MNNAHEIASRLRTVSGEMIQIGKIMEARQGEIAEHGVEMIEAGIIAHNWAEEIDAAMKESE